MPPTPATPAYTGEIVNEPRPHWWPAYVGVGSNLDGPLERVRSAIEELDGLSKSRVVISSSLYRSAPMGLQDQPDFINAVVAMLTRQSPTGLLQDLAQMEDRHGRRRDVVKWGPRTLDLDLLVFGREQRESQALTLPHPGIAARNFVLLPLCEIAPQLEIPGLGSVASLVRALGPETPGIEKLADG